MQSKLMIIISNEKLIIKNELFNKKLSQTFHRKKKDI